MKVTWMLMPLHKDGFANRTDYFHSMSSLCQYLSRSPAYIMARLESGEMVTSYRDDRCYFVDILPG